MMLKNKDSSIVILGLLVALAATPKLLNASIKPVLAQTPTASEFFPLPTTVPEGTTVSIDGSTSMTGINQILKQGFEEQYPGTKVLFQSQGTDAGLKALLDGKVDLAAIGRPITPEEAEQGLTEAILSREKIAIVVGENNPFNGNLSIEQFAKIFRGEITDWSEVGGSPGPIKFIDRPETSDIRQSLPYYPIFQAGKFETGANAKQIFQDSTKVAIGELGNDGISYAPVSEVQNQDNVRTVLMHQTMPDDPRYPFSRPLSLVYNEKTANPEVKAFLGFVTAAPGQQAIAQAQAAVAEGRKVGSTTEASTSGSEASTSGSEASTSGSEASISGSEASTSVNGSTVTIDVDPSSNTNLSASAIDSNAPGAKFPFWPLWLIPAGLLGVLSWLGFKNRRLESYLEEDDGFEAIPDSTSEGDGLSQATANVVGGAVEATEFVSTTTETVSNATDKATKAGGVGLAGGAAVAAGAGATAWSAIKGARQQSRNDESSLEEEPVTLDLPPGASEGASNVGRGMKGKAGDLASGAADAASDLASGAVDKASEGVSGVSDTVSNLTSGASEGASNLVGGMKGKAGDLASGAADAASDLASSAAKGASNLTQEASEIASNLAENAAETISEKDIADS